MLRGQIPSLKDKFYGPKPETAKPKVKVEKKLGKKVKK